MADPEPSSRVDFNNTEIAFAHKSDKQLINTTRLFTFMSRKALVRVASEVGLLAIRLRLPFVKTMIRKTMYDQFCGGETLLDCQETIDQLYKAHTFTILDYGAEGKDTEEDLDAVKEEILRSVEMAASNPSVPVVVAKCSGLAPNDLLEKIQSGTTNLSNSDRHLYDQFYNRIHEICERGEELDVSIFIDAEESWIQDGIDNLVKEMMSTYNREKAIVHNTYQMYRKDMLKHLKDDHAEAIREGYLLGAKVVRGAYMEKERARAESMNYPSPIQDTKSDTDSAYDEAIQYCASNHRTLSFCCATHNRKSTQLLVDRIFEDVDIDEDHDHISFSQLYGMSDFITFNLAELKLNVAKYVPFGAIDEVIPYLIRRAKENSSITGEAGRELQLLKKEVKRRGLSR